MRFDDTCPDDWAFRSIESRCSKITSGGTPSRAVPSFYVGSGGIPWVKTKELNNWFIEDTEERISDEAIRSSSAKMLPKSSVLIAMYGATVGELGILATPMACNQACCALIVNQDTDDERFLFYQLLSRKQDIKNQAVGAAQQNISAQFIRSIELPTPPKAEQKAIAYILGTLDEKIELNLKTNETFEAMAKALFKSWFVDFDPVRAKAEGRPTGLPAEISDLFPDSFEDSELGEIPSGWNMASLGDYVTVKRGGSPRPIQEFMTESGLPWVKISDATSSSNRFIPLTKGFIKENGLAKTVLLKRGSLILSNSATPGIPKFLDLDACIHDGWLYFPEKVYLSDLFLYQFFLWIRPSLVLLGNGSVFTNLKTDILKNYRMSIPPPDLIIIFSQISQVLHDKCLLLSQNSSCLSELRDSLLPRLISGEIRISDAEKMLEEVGV